MEELIPLQEYEIVALHPKDSFYENNEFLGQKVIYDPKIDEKPKIRKIGNTTYISGRFIIEDTDFINNYHNGKPKIYFYGASVKPVKKYIKDPLERINQQIKDKYGN